MLERRSTSRRRTRQGPEQNSGPRQMPAQLVREARVDLSPPTCAEPFVQGLAQAGAAGERASGHDQESDRRQQRQRDGDPDVGRSQLTVDNGGDGGRHDDIQEEEGQLVGGAAADPAERSDHPGTAYRRHRHQDAPAEEDCAERNRRHRDAPSDRGESVMARLRGMTCEGYYRCSGMQLRM